MQVHEVAKKHFRRTMAGFMLSILISSLTLSVLLPIGVELNVASFLVSAIIYVPYSILMHATFGLLAYFILRKYTDFKLWQVILAGALCGGVCCVILIFSSIANLSWLWRMVLASVLSSAGSYGLLRASADDSFAQSKS
ncbi:hypothetical protein [Rhizobacter sp. OV335]|uniref:hypothetical protein n=1 Tax=Rhizobacter sp. OV335 TaxID=1500264 RepID=UPI0011615179|nr:hypothetical protein [Rhizobacter sp. OV335]